MSEQAPTHINAFYVELAEAEKEVAQAQGRVDALKETIATMEQAQEQPTVQFTSQILALGIGLFLRYTYHTCYTVSTNNRSIYATPISIG